MEWKEGRQRLTLDLNLGFFEVEVDLKPLRASAMKLRRFQLLHLSELGSVFRWVFMDFGRFKSGKGEQAWFLVGEVSTNAWVWIADLESWEHLFEKGS